MRKSTLILLAISFVSFNASAATFDAEAIQKIHGQVKENMTERCISEIKFATKEMCECLGDKLQSNIDDEALAKCETGSTGKDCVMKVAQDATAKTMAPDSLSQCMPKKDAITPAKP